MKGSVYAPSFDHGVGDPIEDDIFVDIRWILDSYFIICNIDILEFNIAVNIEQSW